MHDTKPSGVYGTPPAELAEAPEGAIQFSALIPGSARLEEQPEGSLGEMVVLAPPGTVERRYVTALALQALAPGGSLTILAPKDKGGARIAKELKGFGCEVSESSRRHHRICTAVRPSGLIAADEAIAEGGPRLDVTLGLWTWPGAFSWNRIDPGSALLEQTLPPLSGRGADFGCGIGILARSILASPKVERLDMIDIDRRAVEMAARAGALGGSARRNGPQGPRFRGDEPAVPRWRRRGPEPGPGLHPPGRRGAQAGRHPVARRQPPSAV